MSDLKKFKQTADLEDQIKSLDLELSVKFQKTEKKFIESTKEEITNFFEKEGFQVDDSVIDTLKLSYSDKSLVVYFDPERYMNCYFLIKVNLLSSDKPIGKFQISVRKSKTQPSSRLVATELSNDVDPILELEKRINSLKNAIDKYTEPTFFFNLSDVTFNSSNMDLLNDSPSITDVLVTILNK